MSSFITPTPFTPSLSHTDTHTISTTSHTHTHSTTHPSHTSAVLNPAPHTGRAITDSAPKITQTGRAITDSAPKITQTGRAITSHAPQLLLPEDEDEEEEDGSEEAAVHQPDSSAEKDTDEPELKQRKSSPFFSWSLLGSAGFPELPLAPPQDECVLSGYHALGQMLLCLTSRCPDEFHTHGCYCSHQDRGTPVDDWDRCCFIHQCCLDQLGRLGCKKNRKLNAHISCENGQAYCVGVSVCDRLQCVCERVTAECMAATHFSNISQSECSGPRPGCMLKPRMPSSHTHTHTLQ
ncbi:otoconin-90 [Alosa sapidissima]|uniref:otoconin-90 n=1 Tax=Alosa sapidissima TaxID=34773 RepID=UPI001C08F18E|nr:otoconin-90 [Alosa sapidissima]